VLDLFFDWSAIAEDITERPYVTAGFTAFLCLLPLAITSTRGWIRRLGKNWARLHRLAYVAGTVAVIHYWWLAKGEIPNPRRYAVLLVVLLLIRVWFWLRSRSASRART
jgi:sulfoxide reductase heme-binding subunit YedZ